MRQRLLGGGQGEGVNRLEGGRIGLRGNIPFMLFLGDTVAVIVAVVVVLAAMLLLVEVVYM